MQTDTTTIPLRDDGTLRVPAAYDVVYRTIANAPPDRPFVIAQLGQSLDGRIATRTGESRWINGDAALDHVHRLRALVDGVVVGVGTAVADDPALTVRRVAAPSPARIVIDPHRRSGSDLTWLEDDNCRRFLVCHEGVSGDSTGAAECIGLGGDADGRLCPHQIVAALFARGIRRILVEGGAQTVSQFIDAGALDRLHVLVAPVILGSGKTGLDLSPITALADAKRPPTQAYVLDGNEVLFDCNFDRGADVS